MDNTEDEGGSPPEVARHFDFKNDVLARKMFRDKFGFLPMFHTMEGKWEEHLGPVIEGNPGISLQELLDFLRRAPEPATE